MNFNVVFNEDDIVEGIVTRIVKYGAFLSFEGGYFGLLHISEISTNYVNDIHAYFHVGDKINVLVKSVDKKNKYLTVSLKDLPDDQNPFLDILPSRKITSYLKGIDFTKLEKSLSQMVAIELDRIKEKSDD